MPTDFHRSAVSEPPYAYHLAQANVARTRAPLDSPVMADFLHRLDAVNAAADGNPDFVWRLRTSEGNSVAIRAFDDERILFNLSVWRTIEGLQRYVDSAQHLEVFQSRRDWFEQPTRSPIALWWIPAGEIPTIEEGRRRLELLWAQGPTRYAFTFRSAFAAPELAEESAL